MQSFARVPALFPPWTNTATRVVLIGAVLGGAGALALPMVLARSPYATNQAQPLIQPIAFDHRHHVLDEGIACLYCHDGADRAPYAGLPPTERCMGCHSQVWNDSAAIAPLVASWRTGTPIRWQRVHSLPDFVYFDHSIHVARGLDCSRCHGRVDEMAAVYQAEPLTMDWCLDCHRRLAPTRTTCSVCHR